MKHVRLNLPIKQLITHKIVDNSKTINVNINYDGENNFYFFIFRFRILSTIILIAFSVLAWQHWTFLTEVSHSALDYITGVLPYR